MRYPFFVHEYDINKIVLIYFCTYIHTYIYIQGYIFKYIDIQ